MCDLRRNDVPLGVHYYADSDNTCNPLTTNLSWIIKM